jgi:hypothetical protein
MNRRCRRGHALRGASETCSQRNTRHSLSSPFWVELKAGERGGEKCGQCRGRQWVRTGSNTIFLIFVVVGVEVRLLVKIDAAHLRWLT